MYNVYDNHRGNSIKKKKFNLLNVNEFKNIKNK